MKPQNTPPQQPAITTANPTQFGGAPITDQQQIGYAARDPHKGIKYFFWFFLFMQVNALTVSLLVLDYNYSQSTRGSVGALAMIFLPLFQIAAYLMLPAITLVNSILLAVYIRRFGVKSMLGIIYIISVALGIVLLICLMTGALSYNSRL